MAFRVRLALPEDSPAAVEVVRSVYDEYGFTWDEAEYHADLYDLEGAYFNQGHAFWIAEYPDRQAVGTVALERFEAIPGETATLVQRPDQIRIAGCDCALQRLYVRPNGRRDGVGSKLFETSIAWGRSVGLANMEIWSDKRFEQAHRLYQRYGARVVGERICHDPDKSPEWGLMLSL